MSFQRVHDSSPKNSQTSSNHSPFVPRPFPVQQPQRPQTAEELEKQAFEQDKFEAMGLEVKEKRGTITSEESEHLTVLQTKMDSFLQQQLQRAEAAPSFMKILLNNRESAPQNQSVEPIQPSLLASQPIRVTSTNTSSAPLQPKLNTNQPNRITSTPSPTVSLQAKLTVGQPNDQYEQEADRVAERVMSMSPPSTPNIQRQGQEAWTTNINQKPIASSITPLVRLKPESEEEEAIQPKCETCEQEEQIQLSPSLLQASSDGTTQAQPSLESRLNATKGGGSPLPDNVRNFMEPRFGADFSHVQVHTGSEAVQMNRELGAQAFAHGSDIYYGAGKAPGNNELTAHELTHVVQQTGGTSLSAISAVTQPQIAMERETATTEVNTELVGHASPRWEHRHGASREELNLHLSQYRVNEVETYFREIFTQQMADRGTPSFNFTSECIDVNVTEAEASEPQITSSAEGDTQTLGEAGGNVQANDPSMRRVDIRVSLTHHVRGEAPSSEPGTETIAHPEQCQPNATNQWSITLGIGGEFHELVGGALVVGKLKNRLTGQEARGYFLGGGLGVGGKEVGLPDWPVPRPVISPNYEDSWTDFTTEDVCTFEDFDGTLARLTTAGGGLGVGGEFSWISFPMRGANSIDVSGLNIGAIGVGASTNVGVWIIHGTPPGQQCEPQHTEERPTVDTTYTPYTYSVPHQYRHTVIFETGNSRISDSALRQLEQFVVQIVQNYDFSASSDEQ